MILAYVKGVGSNPPPPQKKDDVTFEWSFSYFLVLYLSYLPTTPSNRKKNTSSRHKGGRALEGLAKISYWIFFLGGEVLPKMMDNSENEGNGVFL